MDVWDNMLEMSVPMETQVSACESGHVDIQSCFWVMKVISVESNAATCECLPVCVCVFSFLLCSEEMLCSCVCFGAESQQCTMVMLTYLFFEKDLVLWSVAKPNCALKYLWCAGALHTELKRGGQCLFDV